MHVEGLVIQPHRKDYEVVRNVMFNVMAPIAGLILFLVVGCSDAGVKTVPVNGTLKINGQPAENVTISLVPEDSTKETASGPVSGGNFELYTGVQGTKGALPGKYKVTLVPTSGGSMEDAQKAYMGGGAPGNAQSSAAPKQEAPFPDKYLNASTSDKEVEITSGENNLTIEITGK